MIHINERPKNLPPLASTMCSRRHKGMVQTSLILVLIVCIGYGFYLYNLLQVKVKYLDTKALRHQSQQQSLSSQLQAVYEERARFQKAIQRSKTELKNVKDEKESQIQSMLLEHQDQNQALDKENKELKSRHDKIYKDHDELKKKHQNVLSEHADSINKVNVELQMYKHENEATRKLRKDLEYQIRQNKEKMTLIMSEKAQAVNTAENAESLLNEKTREVSQLRKQNEQHEKDKATLTQEANSLKRMHASLQTLLKGIPVDAINFDHPDIGSLDADDKRHLMDHLKGGKGVSELQNRHDPDIAEHNQVAEDLNEVHPYNNEAADLQPKDQPLDMEQRLNPMEPNDNLQVIDICSLPPDHGPCQDADSISYAYHLGLKECRGFMYGGCGGNQNNFKTPDLCMDVCNDSEKRYIREQIHEENKIGMNRFQAMADLSNPDTNLEENIHDVQLGNEVEETGRPEKNENVNEQNLPQEAADTEQDRLLKEGDLKAKEQEEAAKLELEKQKQQINPDRTEEDHLQKLRENSKLQLELAQDQRSDMEKIIDKQRRDEQQQQQHTENQIEADVEDDNNDRDGEEYEDVNKEEEYEDQGNDNDDDNGEDFAIDAHLVEKDNDDVQVDVPPAAQVAGHDPEAVMNPPPAKQDGIASEEINGQNVYREQEQEDEHIGDNDDLAYGDDNQQEVGDAGVDGNGNADEEEEEQTDNYNREDAGIGEDDKVDDDGGADDYENEEEDSDERRSREFRNYKRVMNDKNFLVRNEVQDMIPPEANLEKEI